MSFRVKSLPAQLLNRICQKFPGITKPDINRVLLVPAELNQKLHLVNFQWVSVEVLGTKSKKVFPCQILVMPESESTVIDEILKQISGESQTPVFYMTPTGLHNLRNVFGFTSLSQEGKSVYKIVPLINKENNTDSVSFSVVPAKTARLAKLSGCGKNLTPEKQEKYLRLYFEETKYVTEGDLITLDNSDAVEESLCLQVLSIEPDENELVVKDLILYSISTVSTSVYMQEKETNGFRPSFQYKLISFGEISHVVPVCVPFLQPHLDSLTDWLQSLCTLRSSLVPKSGGETNCDLMDPENRNHEMWPSCLLTGGLGSGKYTLTKALTVQSGLNFYCVNLVSLIGDTSAFTIAKLSAVIHKARSYAPCVVFIKNIHFLGKDKEGQEDKRVTLAFIDLLNEINSLYGKGPDSEIYLIGETNMVEEILPAYFKWISLLHPQIKLGFDVNNWVISNNVKTTLKSLGDLRALLTLSTRLAYTAHLQESYENCEGSNKLLEASLSNGNSPKDPPFVVTESHVHAALEQLEATERTSVGSPKVPLVTWEDVGGLAETKLELINSVQLPLRFPHFFKSGIKRSGILLYGPPGTGKTLLAKAVASEFKINFFSVKGPELLNMYVGQSEQNVREVFDRARDCSPCVLFFDELDSLAPNRGRSGDSGGVMDRVVSQILAEMDGTHSSPDVFIIGATNRPDLIDPALLRPGRFDKLIYVGINSDAGAVGSILKALTRKFNLSPDVDIQEISKHLPRGMSGADLYAFCSDSYMIAVTRRIQLLESGESEDQESPVVVERQDFNVALTRITPSLSKKELDKIWNLNGPILSLGYVENFNNLSSDRFIRIYAILTCKKTVKLLQIIHDLKSTLKEFQTKDEESKLWKAWHFIGTTDQSGFPIRKASPSAFVAKQGRKTLEKLKGWRNTFSFGKCKVSKPYILLVVNLCVHFTNHIYIFVNALRRDSFVSKQQFFFLPAHEGLSKAVFATNNALIMTAQFFSLGSFVILAQEIADLYKNFIDVLLEKLNPCGTSKLRWHYADLENFHYNHQRVADEVEFKDKYISQFKQLKICCELFSDSHGFYAIVNTGSVILSLGQFAFIFANNTDIMYFSRSIACVIWIYVTIAIGDKIERQCQQASKDIQDVLMPTSGVHINENLREVANWVSQWSCKLTARNIFTINMRLIPGVIGTVLTYVIFLFQLTMSEKFEWGQKDRLESECSDTTNNFLHYKTFKTELIKNHPEQGIGTDIGRTKKTLGSGFQLANILLAYNGQGAEKIIN
ncbi:unnamed protein product [Allacma fusca]|nr:unnamed protein product [Allacma fusca]